MYKTRDSKGSTGLYPTIATWLIYKTIGMPDMPYFGYMAGSSVVHKPKAQLANVGEEHLQMDGADEFEHRLLNYFKKMPGA